MSKKTNLKALSRLQTEEFFNEIGLPKFRASQLIHWIYDRKALSIDEITEFSKELRSDLNDVSYISNLDILKKQVSSDGTVKYLFELEDRERVETVLIPDPKRLTLCVSSQVGCAMSCSFCLTGKSGLKRNLSAFEIVDQILFVEREIGPSKITNIVLMGIGEPLMNLNEVVEALWRLVDLLKISKRRITLSTCGITPKIKELYKIAPDVNLAISLNATTDKIRDCIMPINKRYNLKSIITACKGLPISPGRRITFEYVLLKGINDTEEDARRLTTLLRGIPAKVNLIPFNSYNGAQFTSTDMEDILKFQKVLIDRYITTHIRKSKGSDILAACGQLKSNS